ncbi:MAG TPA: hypothetical protein VIL46_08535 [Gemmataceae bacterium]
METPEWLRRRGGELRRGLSEETWLVLLGGQPQYKLFATPARGKYTCVVTRTVSGRRLDDQRIYPTLEEALRGGLEELRQKLGW